jgi:hypothetical protein
MRKQVVLISVCGPCNRSKHGPMHNPLEIISDGVVFRPLFFLAHKIWPNVQLYPGDAWHRGFSLIFRKLCNCNAGWSGKATWRDGRETISASAELLL